MSFFSRPQTQAQAGSLAVAANGASAPAAVPAALKLDHIEERKLSSYTELKVSLHQQLLDMRSEEHTSELQSLMRISYAVFCLKKKMNKRPTRNNRQTAQQ